MQTRFSRPLLLLVIALLFNACEKTQKTPGPEPIPEASAPDTRAADAAFWDSGHQVLASTQQQAKQLLQNTLDFLQAPSPEQLDQLRSQWQQVQQHWHNFYFFSQMGITQANVFSPLSEYRFLIAAHPIQPGYLDYFGPYPYSGLVHDISVPLTPETLMNQHGMTDAEDVALGIYAIEFMIYGEQQSRPASDFTAVTQLTAAQQEQGFRQVQETPNHRRRELLRLQTEILNRNLAELQTLWQATDATGLRAKWAQLAPAQQTAAVKQNLERTLTQLLLEIVAISPVETTNGATSNHRAAPPAGALGNRIESLAIAAPWLPEATSAVLIACLPDAANAAREAESQESWSLAYQKLKSCLS